MNQWDNCFSGADIVVPVVPVWTQFDLRHEQVLTFQRIDKVWNCFKTQPRRIDHVVVEPQLCAGDAALSD